MDLSKYEEGLRAWDDDEDQGMSNAMDRAHAGGGRDVFGVLSDEPEGGGDMVLPEMDLSEQAPAAEAVRLRAPTQAPSEPPPASVQKAPAGAGPVPSTSNVVRKGLSAGPSPSDAPDWEDLARRLRDAQFSAATTRAASNMFANIAPGYQADLGAGQANIDAAKAPLELAQLRQAFGGKQLAQDMQRSKMGADSAMKDPNSLQSQKAREAFKAFFAGSQLPSGFDNWSADDVGRFAKGATESMKVRAAADERAAKIRAAQDRADAERGALENSRKAFDKDLRDAGVDPAHASQKDIDRVIAANRAAADDRRSNAMFALALEGRKDKDNDRDALGESIPFAGGELRYTGKGTPREDDRKEAQKVASLYGAAIAGMDDLGQAIQDFAAHPGADTKDAVASKARLTAGHLNTAFGQGAMSKDEADAMAQTLGADFRNAAGFQALIDKVVGDDPAAAATLVRKLKAARTNTKASALAKAKAYRYDMTGGDDAGGAKKTPSGKPYARKQQNTKTGAVRYLDEKGNVIEESNG